MANPVCSSSSLNVACFRGYTLPRIQRLAFKVWMLLNHLAAIGGTNYTTGNIYAGTSNLNNDVKQLFDKWDMDAMDSAELAVFYNAALAAGASVSNVPNTITQSTRRLEQDTEENLQKMIIFLECQLGQHKKYTQ